MPALRVGQAEILYELRRSASASQRRITVTPGHVEVMALTSDNDEDIAGFLDRKRQWVFNTVREMERISADRHTVPRFITGSKIPFRGRNMHLTVRRSDADRMEITYRNGFVVDLPAWASGNTDQLVANELKLWLKQRARRDVQEVAFDYRRRFGLHPRSIRVANLAHGWGSCGPDGNILVNWHLIFAPKKVLEYVVAHELTHLRDRSHGPEFWTLLQSYMPESSSARDWLQRNEAAIQPRIFERE